MTREKRKSEALIQAEKKVLERLIENNNYDLLYKFVKNGYGQPFYDRAEEWIAKINGKPIRSEVEYYGHALK